MTPSINVEELYSNSQVAHSMAISVEQHNKAIYYNDYMSKELRSTITLLNQAQRDLADAKFELKYLKAFPNLDDIESLEKTPKNLKDEMIEQ
jgi:hypothetical protein